MVQLGKTARPLLKTRTSQFRYNSCGVEHAKNEFDIDRSPEETPSESEDDAEEVCSLKADSNQEHSVLNIPRESRKQIGVNSERKNQICSASKRKKDTLCLPNSSNSMDIFETTPKTRKSRKTYHLSQRLSGATHFSQYAGRNSQNSSMQPPQSFEKKSFRFPFFRGDLPIKTSQRKGFIGLETSMTSTPDTPNYNKTSASFLNLSGSPEKIDTSQTPIQSTHTVHCLLCDREVDVSQLENSQRSAFKRFRDKQEFCIQHRMKEAAARWERENYPFIDWVNLDQRLSRYHQAINSLLRDRIPSYYRNELEQELEHESLHNILVKPGICNIENLEGGYYGRRGLRRIMEYVIVKFSANIRSAAADDKMITTLGVPGFVQTVIVPELLVLLTMEDFNVSPERARAILRESNGLGDLLFPDNNNDDDDDHDNNDVDE